MEKIVESTIAENQMEKNVQHEMGSTVVLGLYELFSIFGLPRGHEGWA